ncbi:MAG: efflux RND transporter periplasmic adaptor subunit [Acidobacteriota bacterium]
MRLLRRCPLLGLLLLSACAGADAVEVSDPDPVRVVRGDLRPRVLLTGTLRAQEAHELVVPRTPTWEVQIRWMADDGTAVGAGERVVELDNTPFLTDLEEKRLTLAEQREELERIRAEGELSVADASQTTVQRRADLEKARIAAETPASLLPRVEYEERQLALRRAELALEKAEEDLAAARQRSANRLEIQRLSVVRSQREIALAETSVDSLVLVAPTEGIMVVEDHPWEGRKLQIGDSVWVGMKLVRIPDLSTMRVDARLADVDDGRVVPGMAVRCTLDAYPERIYPGRVAQIAPVAKEPSSYSLRRFFKVEIDLAETDEDRMRPGMSVKVEVLPEPVPDVLLAPRGALDLTARPVRARRDGGGWSEVVVGPCDANRCVIENGLAEGDRLAAIPTGGVEGG